MKEIKLNNILLNKCSGEYNYKLNNVFYQIYKYGGCWFVYETTEFDLDLHGNETPYNWNVLGKCNTLKEGKTILLSHLKYVLI